jgi:hypothetical protein
VSKTNIFKIWALTIVFIGLRWIVGTGEIGLFEGVKVIASLIMLYGAFLVTQKKKSTGVWLWLGSDIVLRIIHLIFIWVNIENLEYCGFFILTISSFFIIAIMLIVYRLFLQWTSNIWKETFSFPERFWKVYIGLEVFSFFIFAIVMFGLLDLEGGIRTLFLFGIMYLPCYYGKIIKKRYLPLLVAQMSLVQ